MKLSFIISLLFVIPSISFCVSLNERLSAANKKIIEAHKNIKNQKHSVHSTCGTAECTSD